MAHAGDNLSEINQAEGAAKSTPSICTLISYKENEIT